MPKPQADLDELVAAFRSDPRSNAFFPLATAFLAEGRALEAIDVLKKGLGAHPGHAQARLLLGQALVTVENWTQAQQELMRVVEKDATNVEAFTLLGEACLQNGEMERARLALEQARDLDPTSERVATLLGAVPGGQAPPPSAPSAPIYHGPPPAAPPRTAAPSIGVGSTATVTRAPGLAKGRSSQTLPAPPEASRPLPPLPSPKGPTASASAARSSPASSPSVARSSPPADAPLGRVSIERQRAAVAVEDKVSKGVKDSRTAESVERKKPVTRPPEDPFAPLEPGPEAKRPAPAESGERPRVALTPHKEKDAGAEAMRRSAAVEKDYLGDMLSRGLLDVPNVTARPAGARATPARARRRPWRWVAAVVIAGGLGVGGYLLRGRLGLGPAEDSVPADVQARLIEGRQVDETSVVDQLETLAVHRPKSALVLASLAEARALAFYDYGLGSLGAMNGAIEAAAAAVPPGKGIPRVLVIARAVARVATLPAGADGAAVQGARIDVDRAKSAAPDDPIVGWLDGVVKALEGDREGARALFTKLDGPRARIALGDLALDAGDADAALRAYDEALAHAEKHPLALLGRVLARIDAEADPSTAMQDLNVDLANANGPKLSAWKHVALAALLAEVEQYDKVVSELDEATLKPLSDARFLTRLAQARVDRGELISALSLRGLVAAGADVNLTAPLDAELRLAQGLPAEALALVEKRDDRRARVLRGRALLDLGRFAEAEKELGTALAAATSDDRVRAWHELARVLGGHGGDEAFQALQRVARKTVSTEPRYLLAEADLHLGKSADARRDFEAALDGDPLAYRARVRLGDLELTAGDGVAAEKQARAALEQAPGNLPAQALLGRALVGEGKGADALAPLKAVAAAGHAAAADEIALGSALLGSGDREGAKACVRRALVKGYTAAQVNELATRIDPAFAAELK